MPDKKCSDIDKEIYEDFMEGRMLTVYQVGSVIANVNAKLQAGIVMIQNDEMSTKVGEEKIRKAIADLQMVMCQNWLFRKEPVSGE